MYKVGIIGLGNIGYFYEKDPLRVHPCTHFGAFSQHPETEVVAIADTDENKLKQFSADNPKVHVYLDYEDLLNREAPDIVSICTPVNTHYKLFRNIIRFNSVKLVFCEKPMASNLSEAKDMIREAKEFGVLLAVNFTRRWDDTYIMVKKSIDSGAYGELLRLVACASREKDFSGNIHMLDLLNWYGGNMSNISYVDCYPCNYLIFELDVILSKGRIIIKDNGRTVDTYSAGESTHYQIDGNRKLNELQLIHSIPQITFPMLNAVNNINIVLDARNLNPTISLNCTGKDALKAMELYELLKKGAVE